MQMSSDSTMATTVIIIESILISDVSANSLACGIRATTAESPTDKVLYMYRYSLPSMLIVDAPLSSPEVIEAL